MSSFGHRMTRNRCLGSLLLTLLLAMTSESRAVAQLPSRYASPDRTPTAAASPAAITVLGAEAPLPYSRPLPQGDVAVATRCVPAIEAVPVRRLEVIAGGVGPRDKVSPVVRRKVDAVALVVRSDGYAADVHDGVLAGVLFVDAEHVGWCGRIDLHVLIKRIPILLAEIASFAHPDYD